MKVLFIENKQKTKFWECIAKKLLDAGHEIFWIVQNKMFAPKIGEKYLISKPRKSDLIYSDKFQSLEKKDRFCYVYKQKPLHYDYYYSAINDILDVIQPDYVFGESTLFHELLTIICCKDKGILYLNPSTCRYPNGRFSFYQYDTQEPYLGSCEIWDEEVTHSIVQEIVSRKKQPDYMNKAGKIDGFYHRVNRYKGLFYSLWASEIIGETYNTPTLKHKILIEKRCKTLRRKYESMAFYDILQYKPDRTLIFPLQMQPESNIDVWGYPYNSQSLLIKQLSSKLGDKWNILIKPNPKSKYEISEELIDAINSCENVYPLKHNVTMKQLFSSFKFFFSVTGTINHESILSNDKKCFSPVLPITKIFTPNLAKIPEKKDLIANQETPKLISKSLIKYLIYTSYQGLIGDYVHSPEAFTNKNINEVVDAFLSVLREK